MNTFTTHLIRHKGLLVLLAILVSALMLLAVFQSAKALAVTTYYVIASSDEADALPGNCLCLTALGSCSLRAAIQEANACPGAQTIRFIGSPYILPTTALPPLTDNGTTINGSDVWQVSPGGVPFPGVTVDGNGQPFNGLVITATKCAVYGITIINFGHNGVYLYDGAQYNNIGGWDTNERNIISINGWNGVRIEGTATMSNTVAQNYIGTNSLGTGVFWGLYLHWGNSQHGVSVWDGQGNQVVHNLVADNGWSGVTVDAASGVQVNDNHIGMDVNGQPLGNVYFGVQVSHGADPKVSYNEIAFNKRGIHIDGGSHPWIYHNTIYSNTANMLTPPQGGGILVSGATTFPLIDLNEIYSNTAQFGGGIAVRGNANSMINENTIRHNRAYTAGHMIGGGGIFITGASATILDNQILTNTSTGDFLAFPSSDGGGIYLEYVGSATVQRNTIQGNVVEGNNGGGGGINITGRGIVNILRNRIIGNSSSTASYNGSGIHISNDPASSKITLEGNWIALNKYSDGAVYLYASDYVTLTNNVIAHNTDPGLYIQDSGDHIKSIHNTIARNDGSGIVLHGSHLDLYNTIVVSNTWYGIEVMDDFFLAQTHNAGWGNGLGMSNGGMSFYIEADPLFFDASKDLYALKPASPCIDAGHSPHSSPTSYNQVSRPQGSLCDIGAYEMPLPLYLPVVFRNY